MKFDTFVLIKRNQMAKISTIGVLTSGGDAPGMNAAIRAVTRAAIYNGWKIKAIYRGWEGLINNEIKDFTSESVSGIINQRKNIVRMTCTASRTIVVVAPRTILAFDCFR